MYRSIYKDFIISDMSLQTISPNQIFVGARLFFLSLQQTFQYLNVSILFFLFHFLKFFLLLVLRTIE